MYTSSIMSRSSMVSTIMQSVQSTQPAIRVTFKGEDEVAVGDEKAKLKATCFTTLDKIEGEVSFVAPSDMRFDDVYIGLEGVTRVWMERYGATPGGPLEAIQTFLKVAQPIEESAFPIPRIAEKGRIYTFPFMFVVPERLLPTSCTHHCRNQAVAEAHLRLPPSLGDDTTPTFGGCNYDDIAPDMTRISYAIRVKILKRRDVDNKAVVLADDFRKIRIVPTNEDLPPQVIDGKDKDLVLSKERVIRKGLLKGKLGKLTVSAEEPRPLHSHHSTQFGCPPTTMIPITLTFRPEDPSYEPPALYSLNTKLRVHTYFSTNPMLYFPTPSSIALDGTLGRFYESILMGTQNLGGVKWKQQSSLTNSVYYMAEIRIPLVTPKCKTLVPSFYSCNVARSYTLELHVDVSTPGYNMGAHPGITLKVPLQVSNPHPASSAASSNDEAEDEEDLPGFADEYFTPRSIAPPNGIPILSEVTPGGRHSSFEFDHGVRVVPEQVQNQHTQQEARIVQLPPHMTMNRPNLPPPPGYSFFPGFSLVRIPSPVGISPGCG